MACGTAGSPSCLARCLLHPCITELAHAHLFDPQQSAVLKVAILQRVGCGPNAFSSAHCGLTQLLCLRNRRYAKAELMPCGRHIWQVTTFSGEQRAVKVASGSYDEPLHQELAKACPSELLQGLDAALNLSYWVLSGSAGLAWR